MNATNTTSRITVWDLPTRVFHWSLAACFAGAFLTAESERWRDVHVMLGYALLGLIAFRLVWGVVGSRYARFSSFVAGPGAVGTYLRSLLSGNPEHHVGHNPAGALAILVLLGLGLLAGATGWAVYNDIGGEWVEELHEGAAYAMLAVVGLHIAGVIVSSLLHRENLVAAMITGRKQGAPDQAISRRHGVLGMLLLGAVIAFWVIYAAKPGLPEERPAGVSGKWAQAQPVAGYEHRKREHDD